MKATIKPAISLSALVLFGLALSGNAAAHGDSRTNEQIQTCVAAIGDRADYSDAERVVHTVTRLRQRNYAELEIRVDTAVIRNGDVREYAASCVTDTLNDVVRLRVNAVED